MKQMRFAIGVAVLAAVAAIGAWGAPVDEATALTVAERFLQTSKMAARALPDRSVESIEQRGNLWIARLEPSGHILVSGSDRATPIIGFSKNDFDEGREDSPERAALDAADEAVAAAEADETKGRHARWDCILSETTTGTQKKSRRLLASSGSGANIEPFITSRYNQCQPWNDLTPVVSKDTDAYYRGRSLAGCVSEADAALVRAVRWPVYPARTDTVTHSFREGTFDIRFDGSAPFNWDLMQDTYPVSGDLRGRLAEGVRYEIGHLLMWLNHSARMTYNAGESTSTKYNAAHGGERDWYTIGRNMVPTAEGVEDIVTATLAAGIPVFVGVGGHAAATDRSITLTGLQSGSDYSFTVMPYLYGALVPGETSDAKFTSIAETSLCLPEITLLQYQADGNALKNLTDGILADGAIGTMTIKVGCSGNVADLKASPSHVELVDDSKVHIKKKSDGYWYITFDPSIPENRNRQRQILTLHAKDSNGTTIHRDIVMRMTADSGIEGGADVDDDIMLYTPKARPIAVWNGDFNSVTTRGAVTLNLNGNITTNDGAAVVKTAGKSGIDFAIAGGGTFIFGIAGVSEFAITSEDTATLISVATSAAEEDAGLGVSCQNSGLYKYRGLLGSVKGDWFTGGNTYPNDGGLHSLAFKATTEKVECWLDASASSENSESVYSTTYVRLENSATTDLVLGGWKSATAFGATGTKFNHVAVFTDDNVSAGDMYNWNLKNMTGAVTVPASGGALTALDTGRNLGINLNGGRVALDEPVYAAALFVQDDTTLEVPMGFGVSGSRVLYVAPGKTLTVDVICDGTALSNAVSAAGGVYTSRILQGANYGDVVSGSLPDIGSRYTVELVQVDTEGVYFRVTDTRALNIYNDDGSDVPVGYVTDAGKSCIITNATGLITIPAMVEQVNIYAKDDVLNFKVAAGSSPNFVIYASNAAGKPEPGSGWGIVLTSLFARPDSGDDTIISLALDPEAVHNDVKVRPEFDMTAADEVLSFSGTGENKIVALPVKVIPGLWYCVEYADNVGFDGPFMTSPATVTTVGAKSTTLTAPASATKTFYRVRVGSSKSSLTVQ